jgi:hypothetical protein
MRFSQCPLWLLVVFVVTGFGLTCQTAQAQAQSSLPQSILQAGVALTPAEEATVDQFVDAQASRLQDQDPEQVALGRSLIVEQFSLSNSSFFLDYYRQSIANRVAPLLDPEGPLMTRLNVAIISAKLSGASLIHILQAGADDPSPAVRYWIAKAVGAAAKKAGQLDPDEQRDALTVLTRRLKLEEASLVLEQVFLAMSEIQLPEAIQKVLEGLDSRVTFHKKNPNAQYRPVYGGMQQLWRKLIGLDAAGQNVDKELRDLGRIALRYYTLSADQLVGGVKDKDAEDDKINMIRLSRQVLDYVAKEAQVQAPPPINTVIAAKNWEELRLTADRWREILKASPFNFTDKQLDPAE